MALKMEQKLITPKLAAELLEKNIDNRNIKPRHVMKLARAIQRGEWQPDNPAPIVMNGTRLFDGQHRLAAVIEADKAVKMFVVSGASERVMASIDTGISRTMTDTLVMRGEKYASNLAGTLTQLYIWQTQRVIGGKAAETPSHAELIAILDANPELRETVAEMMQMKEALKMGSFSLLAAGHWLFSQIDEEGSEDFFRRLGTGVGLEEGDPILALRRVLMDNSRRPKRGRVLGALLVKAWNAYLLGEEIRVLSWRGGGPKPEAFPIVEGAEEI